MSGPEFAHFRDLTWRHVNRDLHVHTHATDGEASVPEVIARAEALGLGEIAFTEHIRAGSTYFPGFAAEVAAARRSARVRVFVGFEAKAQDDRGTLDAPGEALGLAEVVLGSVHRFPGDGGTFLPASAFSYEEAASREFGLALALIRQAPIHVLSHPGGMCLRAFGRFPGEYHEALMEAALARGVAVEINNHYLRDLDGFLTLCQRVNPLVSIGSDAHRLQEIGACRDALQVRGIGCP